MSFVSLRSQPGITPGSWVYSGHHLNGTVPLRSRTKFNSLDFKQPPRFSVCELCFSLPIFLCRRGNRCTVCGRHCDHGHAHSMPCENAKSHADMIGSSIGSSSRSVASSSSDNSISDSSIGENSIGDRCTGSSNIGDSSIGDSSIRVNDSFDSSSSIGATWTAALHWTMWETIILYFVSDDNFNSAGSTQSAALELA